jgi:hypothetical protein
LSGANQSEHRSPIHGDACMVRTTRMPIRVAARLGIDALEAPHRRKDRLIVEGTAAKGAIGKLGDRRLVLNVLNWVTDGGRRNLAMGFLAPLADVAVHVKQAEIVRLELTHHVCLAAGVCDVPGVVGQDFIRVSVVVVGHAVGAGGEFPLRLSC